MPILRQWPIPQRCPRPSLKYYALRTRPPYFSLSGPHRAASSGTPRPGNHEGKWSIYNSVFINNVYVRITTLVLLSGTLLHYGAHLETVPDVNGRRRLMLISEENMENQCTVTYKLLREKIKDHLVGLQDDRVKRVHVVFERLLEGSQLIGIGRRWEIMVVDNDSAMQFYPEPIELQFSPNY